MSLDPAAKSLEVTTAIATRLAWTVRSINTRLQVGLDRVQSAAQSDKTALFVMQCIFAMFADSVELIERRSFLELLKSYRGQAGRFNEGAKALFMNMDAGGYCVATQQAVRRFNGGLFHRVEPIALNEAELTALIEAAQCDWTNVEPAIFGALLEQALDEGERAELGAHYTPRAYVERLVEPTIMEPLRTDWEAVEVDAIGRYLSGDAVGARRIVRSFHEQLCRVRVLDPACGTGNFLYVAMRMMKELEEEVLGALADMGERQGVLGLDGHVVSPEQFYGLEKNANAAWIAEVVMWIGYLQWHFRVSKDTMPSDPILKNFRRVAHADALLSFSGVEVVQEERSASLARSEDRKERLRYVDPRPTPWPSVHFIIGNPPFIGGKDLRRELGDGYVEALSEIRGGRFQSADLVTAWWDRAAEILTAPGSVLRRFGFITTNSITQTFSRRVLEHHLQNQPPIRLVFAIADHPWIRGVGCADVRIAMSVAERGDPDGQARWLKIRNEAELTFEERHGVIGADLKLDSRLTRIAPLKANALLAHRGVQLMGGGFLVTEEKALALSAGSEPGAPSPFLDYRNGRDLADHSRGLKVIDFFGWEEGEVRRQHPLIYQHLLETVKPERDRNNRATYRDNWWIFGEPRRELRAAAKGLDRYIVTIETAKHRWFRFMDGAVAADNKLVVIASDDPMHLGVLSSRQHRAWFAANAGRIGEYEREAVYVKGSCFDAFPFPDLNGCRAAEIAALAEEVDELRARVLARHPSLTMTGLYNARAKLNHGVVLTEAEQEVHEMGCIGVLDYLHQRLDQAVAAAYGWPNDLSDAQIVDRLIVLNQHRAEQEACGEVRFLRPGYQATRVTMTGRPRTAEINLPSAPVRTNLSLEPGEMASNLLTIMRKAGVPMPSKLLIDEFDGGRAAVRRQVEQTLAVLAVTGAVQRSDAGWFAPRRTPR